MNLQILAILIAVFAHSFGTFPSRDKRDKVSKQSSSVMEAARQQPNWADGAQAYESKLKALLAINADDYAKLEERYNAEKKAREKLAALFEKEQEEKQELRKSFEKKQKEKQQLRKGFEKKQAELVKEQKEKAELTALFEKKQAELTALVGKEQKEKQELTEANEKKLEELEGNRSSWKLLANLFIGFAALLLVAVGVLGVAFLQRSIKGKGTVQK